MLLEGSTHLCKSAPCDISTHMHPSTVIYDDPNTVSGQSGTANCSDGDGAISGTAAFAVSSDPTFPGPTGRGTLIGDTCKVFCDGGSQAILYDLPAFTCACDSSDNPVDWKGEVPICLEVTCDLRVDSSECLSSPTMKHVLFAVQWVTWESATRLSQSLRVTVTVTSRVPWSVRRSRWTCPPSECWPSASCLATITSSRQTVTCQELRCKRQRLALRPSRKWWTKRFRNIKSWASVVSYEVVHALNPTAGGWESPQSDKCLVSK